MNEGRTKNERRTNEERTRTERRIIEEQHIALLEYLLIKPRRLSIIFRMGNAHNPQMTTKNDFLNLLSKKIRKKIS